jgi:cell division protein FtsQ
MKITASTPLDVKLMNLSAIVMFAAFALLLASSLAFWLARQSVFDIRAISVGGDVTHNNAVTLRANVAPLLSGTFLTLNLQTAKRAFEAVPWVRQAVVRRDFPNRLKVQLQEHQALAYWGAEGDSKLVNSFGEVFEANLGEVEQDALPSLSGPQGQAAVVLAMYQTLAPQFEAMELTLERLELTVHGGWRARMDNDASIELGGGSASEVTARLQRFLKTLTQVSSRYGRRIDALESADLRHPDGYAIRLRGVTTLAADGVKK